MSLLNVSAARVVFIGTAQVPQSLTDYRGGIHFSDLFGGEPHLTHSPLGSRIGFLTEETSAHNKVRGVGFEPTNP